MGRNIKTLKCKNIRLGIDYSRKECNGFLATLTDAQLDVLLIDPEARSEFRCHSCPAEMRWITVRGENGKLIYEPGPDEQKFHKEPAYDTVLICEQGG